MMVAPERDMPGTSASVWQTPMPRRRDTGVCSTRCTVGTGLIRSTASITTPPRMKVHA